MATDYQSFLDGIIGEVRQNTPVDVPNILRQYIAEERKALAKSG